LTQRRTLVADSGNLRERFNLIGSIVSECFSSTFAADPIGAPQRPATISWDVADGLGVSRSQMTPMRLVSNRGSERHRRLYHAVIADQPVKIRIDGHRDLQIRPHEMVVVNSAIPSEWHMLRNFETSALLIEPDLFHQHLPDADRILGRRLQLPIAVHEALRSIIDAAWSFSQNNLFGQAGPGLARSFLELLSVATKSPADSEHEVESARYKALEFRRTQVKSYINRHFGDPDLSVGTIAEVIHISPRYVQLAFASERMTPSEYIRQVRLEACARILAAGESQRSITEIAFNCGFNSSAYFSTQFRKHFGMSPRQYRARSGGTNADSDGCVFEIAPEELPRRHGTS
jgi:AraC-like DNA-binding protein